jgi:Transposase zinc-binding domain
MIRSRSRLLQSRGRTSHSAPSSLTTRLRLVIFLGAGNTSIFLILFYLPLNVLRFLKPAVEDVVNKYLDCGDLSKGFARLHCAKCNKDYLLAFSCKGRWFCPSCHEKKVLLFGEFIKESVAYRLPHFREIRIAMEYGVCNHFPHGKV